MKLTESDLQLIKDNAISEYNAIPVRAQLPGSTRVLTEDEKRSLAYLAAALQCLNRISGGALAPLAEELSLRTVVMTDMHNILDEETGAVSAVRANRT